MAFSYDQPFVIVTAFIVRDNKLLLIQENQPPDLGKWNIPGGKLDFGEDPVQAVRREAKEEAGLDFMPTAILGIHSVHRKDVPPGKQKGHEVHVLRIVYVGKVTGEVRTDGGEAVDGIEEISAYRWVELDDVVAMKPSELRYHGIQEFVRDYRAGISYPLLAVKHVVQG